MYVGLKEEEDGGGGVGWKGVGWRKPGQVSIFELGNYRENFEKRNQEFYSIFFFAVFWPFFAKNLVQML